MVVFLANRRNLQSKRLHERLKNRFQSDTEFSDGRTKRASPRAPGPYRITAETDPRTFLDTSAYPTTEARIEVGFDLFAADPYEHYWFNWIEPERNALVGWHRDDTHSELGRVHLQVNDGDDPVVRQPATFVDSHPLDVFDRRLGALPRAVRAVEWDGGRPGGLDY